MNRENLQRIADFIPTIPQESFDMSTYRWGFDQEPECKSIGCVIGHCTILDKDNILANHIGVLGRLKFTEWSEEFTGLSHLSYKWDWCFSSLWASVDNTVEGARKRILYLLDKGRVPEGFDPYDIYPEIAEIYSHY